MNGGHDPIADLRYRFEKTRRACRIPQRLTDLLHGRVETLVELDELVLRPKAFLQLLAGHDLPWFFQEGFEDAVGLVLKSYLDSPFAQLTRTEVCLEHAESDDS